MSLLSGIGFTFIIGHIIDRYNGTRNVKGGFLFIAAAMLILNICNFISLMLIKKDSIAMNDEYTDDTPSFSEVIKNSIGGICGFLVSLLGGKILEAVQNNGNSLFGLHIYGQQLLAAISLVILAATVAYVHFVIERQKVKIQ